MDRWYCGKSIWTKNITDIWIDGIVVNIFGQDTPGIVVNLFGQDTPQTDGIVVNLFGQNTPGIVANLFG